MNSDIEKLILLRQSGELSPEQEAQLESALAEPENQSEADFVDFIFSAVKEDQPSADLPDMNRERILASAVHALQAERPTNLFAGRWVAAAAAFIVLLTSLWLFQSPNPELKSNGQVASHTDSPTELLLSEQESEIDNQLEEISSMLASLSEEFSTDYYSPTDQEELSLEEIASELLSLQSEEI